MIIIQEREVSLIWSYDKIGYKHDLDFANNVT